MIKKILTILVCGVMIFALTGCGSNSNSLSAEDKEKIVSQIESYVVQDRKSQENGYKNSYDVTITNIEVEDLKVKFSGKIYIKYSDGSKNNDVIFEGTSSIKPNPYSIYNTKVEYNY